MSDRQASTLRGRVGLRPWRIGYVLDTTDADAVRGAIAELSAVWGGCLMPLINEKALSDNFELVARQ